MHSRTLRSAGLCDVSVVASPAKKRFCGLRGASNGSIGIAEEELLGFPAVVRESAAPRRHPLRAEHAVRDGDEQLEEL